MYAYLAYINIKNMSELKLLNMQASDMLDEDQGFFPIMSDEDEERLSSSIIPETLSILPLRNLVLFPGVVFPITVGRDKSLALIKKAYKKKDIIGCVVQKDLNIEEPTKEDIYFTGTTAKIIKMFEMPDGTTSIIIQGQKRFSIEKITKEEPYFEAKVKEHNDIKNQDNSEEFNAIIGSLKDLSFKIIKLSQNIPSEASFAIKNIENSTFLINFICSNVDIEIEQKQDLLQIDDLKTRAIRLLEYLTKEIQKLELRNEIKNKVKTDLDKQQKEYFLNQEIKTIQEELGGNPIEKEIEELLKKGKEKKWTKKTGEHFKTEVEKLRRMHPSAPDYSIQLNYVKTVIELPWNEFTKDNLDLGHAKKVLDKHHFGLESIKERILEYLAVLKLKGDLKSPILCLVGPPGVGKTSLGKSIAAALERKYGRIALGGLHDESEIRGHRKTYIGAMPGRIIENIKKVNSSNPVFILDEIDKVGSDFRGDPSSALLEVLDPEQNNTFHDNFLELDYDLSNVMFIATANSLNTINPALLDRMEVIELSGYLVEEKVEIAKKHLIPKLLTDHGVKAKELKLSKKIIEEIAENYTRESGVRQLNKTIAKVIRATAKKIAFNEEYNASINKEDLLKILKSPSFSREKYEGNDYAGVVTGLAWTSVGGTILLVETSLNKGKGKITLTGNLGDVMKESATIAVSYLKANHDKYNIPIEAFSNWDINIHFPEGATPKDGPSAGITLVTSLASAFTQKKIKKNLAMTGEITLRGKVLPVGGIKEKILAAKRAGIKEIIMSKENKKDIDEINELYTKGLNFIFVEKIEEVLDNAILNTKVSGFKVIK